MPIAPQISTTDQNSRCRRETFAASAPARTCRHQTGGRTQDRVLVRRRRGSGAELSVGLCAPITKDRFEETLRGRKIIDYIHKIAVHEGDVVFLPAGRLHAVGAGNLLIEIQQNSDTTYRVFDWNRTDPKSGKARELHVAKAIQCIDFEDVQPRLIQPEGELLLSHSLFEIRKWNLHQSREAVPLGQFAIVCCLKGKLCCANVELNSGEIFLVPARLQDRQLKPLAPQTTLLRITIP